MEFTFMYIYVKSPVVVTDNICRCNCSCIIMRRPHVCHINYSGDEQGILPFPVGGLEHIQWTNRAIAIIFILDSSVPEKVQQWCHQGVKAWRQMSSLMLLRKFFRVVVVSRMNYLFGCYCQPGLINFYSASPILWRAKFLCFEFSFNFENYSLPLFILKYFHSKAFKVKISRVLINFVIPVYICIDTCYISLQTPDNQSGS